MRAILLSAFAVAIVTAPSAQTPVTATVGTDRDNSLYEDPLGGLSNGAGSRLFAGRTLGGETRRALLRFDIAAAIPPGAAIQSARLELTIVMARGIQTGIDAHAVSRDWGEGTSVAGRGQGIGAPATPGDATWIHTFFPGSTWTQPGGDFDPTVLTTTTAATTGSFTLPTTPALVDAVQGWLDRPAANFGLLLRADESLDGGAKAIASREDPIAADRPRLVITYDPPQAAATPFGRGCAGSGATPLALAAVGLPTSGNAAFALELSGGPPSTAGVVAFAVAPLASPLPIPGGCEVWLDPGLIIDLRAVGAGRRAPLPIPADPQLLGAAFPAQGADLDPATGLVLTSNALALVIGG